MGWQSPQPGHQSAGSLRKHLRELGRHSRKVQTGITGRSLRARVPLPAGLLLQPLLGHTGYQHRPGRHPQHHGDRAWAAPATAAAAVPPRCLACTPRTPTPAEPLTHELPGTKPPLPQVSTLRRGQKRKPCLQKSHQYPAGPQHTAHRAGESKHHGTPHAWHSLPVPKATSKAASHWRRGVGKPQPSTSCQIHLASPPTCNFHWLLIVQAVAAASFRDLCPKGCLQKQVSESACAQRSKRSTYNRMLKVNRCKVSANFTSLCYSWSTAT